MNGAGWNGNGTCLKKTSFRGPLARGILLLGWLGLAFPALAVDSQRVHDPSPEIFPLDSDGDGIPDAQDPCPTDRNNDTDGDGLCAPADRCPGGDDRLDLDGDGWPDACDICPDDALDVCQPYDPYAYDESAPFQAAAEELTVMCSDCMGSCPDSCDAKGHEIGPVASGEVPPEPKPQQATGAARESEVEFVAPRELEGLDTYEFYIAEDTPVGSKIGNVFATNATGYDLIEGSEYFELADSEEGKALKLKRSIQQFEDSLYEQKIRAANGSESDLALAKIYITPPVDYRVPTLQTVGGSTQQTWIEEGKEKLEGDTATLHVVSDSFNEEYAFLTLDGSIPGGTHSMLDYRSARGEWNQPAEPYSIKNFHVIPVRNQWSWSPDDSAVQVMIKALVDSLKEDTEGIDVTFASVRLSTPARIRRLKEPQVLTVYIKDKPVDDWFVNFEAPTLSLVIRDAEADEAGRHARRSVSFDLHLEGDETAHANLPVRIVAWGPSSEQRDENGKLIPDFILPPGTLTLENDEFAERSIAAGVGVDDAAFVLVDELPFGKNSKTITLTVADDTTLEGVEDWKFSVANPYLQPGSWPKNTIPPLFTVGDRTGSVTVLDNDTLRSEYSQLERSVTDHIHSWAAVSVKQVDTYADAIKDSIAGYIRDLDRGEDFNHSVIEGERAALLAVAAFTVPADMGITLLGTSLAIIALTEIEHVMNDASAGRNVDAAEAAARRVEWSRQKALLEILGDKSAPIGSDEYQGLKSRLLGAVHKIQQEYETGNQARALTALRDLNDDLQASFPTVYTPPPSADKVQREMEKRIKN